MPNQFTAALFKLIHMTVPLAYIFIFLLFLSELLYYIPEDSALARTILMVAFKTKSSPCLATWAFLEGIFYIFFKLHLVYLQVGAIATDLPCCSSDDQNPISVLSKSCKMAEKRPS